MSAGNPHPLHTPGGHGPEAGRRQHSQGPDPKAGDHGRLWTQVRRGARPGASVPGQVCRSLATPGQGSTQHPGVRLFEEARSLIEEARSMAPLEGSWCPRA